MPKKNTGKLQKWTTKGEIIEPVFKNVEKQKKEKLTIPGVEAESSEESDDDHYEKIKQQRKSKWTKDIIDKDDEDSYQNQKKWHCIEWGDQRINEVAQEWKLHPDKDFLAHFQLDDLPYGKREPFQIEGCVNEVPVKRCVTDHGTMFLHKKV